MVKDKSFARKKKLNKIERKTHERLVHYNCNIYNNSRWRYYDETHLNKTADELINNLQDLKQKTILAKETENRENIKKQINEIDEKWEEINKTWAEIVVHQELDNIHQSLTKAKSNIEEGGLEMHSKK